MEHFAAAHPERVVEVLDVSSPQMIPHGKAIDRVLELRDDGELFCLIDPDIKARGPFLAEFAERLDGGCAGVSSGRGVWTDSDVVPEGHPGVAGEYFFSQQGYVFGGPHFAAYRSELLRETTDRWGVGFASGGPDLSDEAKARLADEGHRYLVYDTGKLVNVFLQIDGNSFFHFEHPNLLHIGGMSHYLSPPEYVHREEADGQLVESIRPKSEESSAGPGLHRWEWPGERFNVARFTGESLAALCAGEAAPDVPAGLDASLRERLEMVLDELVDLVDRYGPLVRAAQ